MEEIQSFRHKPQLLVMLIWCVVIGALLFVSVEGTKPFQEAFLAYEKPTFSPNNMDIMDYFEREAYNRVHQSYQLRVMRSIIVVGVGLIGLVFMVKPGRIEVSDEGIWVYSRGMKKARLHRKWQDLNTIHIGAGQGVFGLLSQTGLLMTYFNSHESKQTEFISTGSYGNETDLLTFVESLEIENLTITKDSIEVDDVGVQEMLCRGWQLFKSNYKNYLMYSLIVSIFAGLQQYFKLSPASSIATAAGIYFSFRALIGLYHHIYCDYNKMETTFDDSWAYGESQLGRMIGASIVLELSIGLLILSVIGMGFMTVNLLAKSLAIFSLAVICFWLYTRLNFIPYIAALMDKNTSYMAINSQLKDQLFKHKLVLSLFTVMRLLILGLILWVNKLQPLTGLDTLQKGVYINIILSFLLTPYIACCALFCLKSLSLKEVVIEERGVVIEEVVE